MLHLRTSAASAICHNFNKKKNNNFLSSALACKAFQVPRNIWIVYFKRKVNGGKTRVKRREKRWKTMFKLVLTLCALTLWCRSFAHFRYFCSFHSKIHSGVRRPLSIDSFERLPENYTCARANFSSDQTLSVTEHDVVHRSWFDLRWVLTHRIARKCPMTYDVMWCLMFIKQLLGVIPHSGSQANAFKRTKWINCNNTKEWRAWRRVFPIPDRIEWKPFSSSSSFKITVIQSPLYVGETMTQSMNSLSQTQSKSQSQPQFISFFPRIICKR